MSGVERIGKYIGHKSVGGFFLHKVWKSWKSWSSSKRSVFSPDIAITIAENNNKYQ